MVCCPAVLPSWWSARACCPAGLLVSCPAVLVVCCPAGLPVSCPAVLVVCCPAGQLPCCPGGLLSCRSAALLSWWSAVLLSCRSAALVVCCPAGHCYVYILQYKHYVTTSTYIYIYKNKNISEKMSEYVGFSPPPTYFLHTLLGLACLVGLQ